jgi:hypothetical protein
MNVLGYVLFVTGAILFLIAIAIYSYMWMGFNGHSVDIWKVCAASGFLLLILGFVFGKARC